MPVRTILAHALLRSALAGLLLTVCAAPAAAQVDAASCLGLASRAWSGTYRLTGQGSSSNGLENFTYSQVVEANVRRSAASALVSGTVTPDVRFTRTTISTGQTYIVTANRAVEAAGLIGVDFGAKGCQLVLDLGASRLEGTDSLGNAGLPLYLGPFSQAGGFSGLALEVPITNASATRFTGQLSKRDSVFPLWGADADWTVTWDLTSGPACTFDVTGVPSTIPVGGQAGTFSVAASGADCTWRAESTQAWFSVNGETRTGSGNMAWTAAPNDTGAERLTVLRVADKMFTITQPACTLTVSGVPSNVAAGGQSGVISVTADRPNCSWTATSSQAWFTLTPTAGTGSGTLNWTAASNPTGAARLTVLTIAGQTFTVTQAAQPNPGGCAVTLTPSGQVTVEAEGRNQAVTVSGVGCTWTATSAVPWATVFPVLGGTPATTTVTVRPNFDTEQRTGTVTIGGQTLIIVQAGMSGTANERFVRCAYFGALRRLPATADVSASVARLGAGTTRAQLMSEYLDSLEFRNGGMFVSGLYRVLLGRVPEKSGWEFQLDSFVRFGTARRSLTEAFLGTPEWILKQGTSITDSQFVTVVYQEVLGRSPSAAEIAFQVSNLDGTAAKRADMALAFLLGPEFFLRHGSRLSALHAYFVVLGRDPSLAELQALEAQLAGGAPFVFGSVVSSFLSGPGACSGPRF